MQTPTIVNFIKELFKTKYRVLCYEGKEYYLQDRRMLLWNIIGGPFKSLEEAKK